MLQILGCKWPQPVQWLLKAPTIHSCFLATLLKVYPDACLVVTHRRPVEVLPSWCKFVLSPMCATLWRHGTKRTLLRKKALEQLELFERIEQSIAAARETHGAQMFDVQCALGSRATAFAAASAAQELEGCTVGSAGAVARRAIRLRARALQTGMHPADRRSPPPTPPAPSECAPPAPRTPPAPYAPYAPPTLPSLALAF